jgi:hypothetical protein
MAMLILSAPTKGAKAVLNPTRASAHDRRITAFHEAGHMVAAWWRGVEAEGIIKPSPAVGENIMDANQWDGWMREIEKFFTNGRQQAHISLKPRRLLAHRGSGLNRPKHSEEE